MSPRRDDPFNFRHLDLTLSRLKDVDPYSLREMCVEDAPILFYNSGCFRP